MNNTRGVGGVTVIGRGPSYSKTHADLALDQYRFLVDNGSFSATRFPSFFPTSRNNKDLTKQNNPSNKSSTSIHGDETDALSKSLERNRKSAALLHKTLKNSIPTKNENTDENLGPRISNKLGQTASVPSAEDDLEIKSCETEKSRSSSSENWSEVELANYLMKYLNNSSAGSERTSSNQTVVFSDLTPSSQWSKTTTTTSEDDVKKSKQSIDTKESKQGVHTKESAQSVHTKKCKQGVHTKESKQSVHTKESGQAVHTKKSKQDVHTKESKHGGHTKKSKHGVHTKGSKQGVHTRESKQAVHTRESMQGVRSKESKYDEYIKKSKHDVHTRESKKSVHTKISKHGVHTRKSKKNVRTKTQSTQTEYIFLTEFTRVSSFATHLLNHEITSKQSIDSSAFNSHDEKNDELNKKYSSISNVLCVDRFENFDWKNLEVSMDRLWQTKLRSNLPLIPNVLNPSRVTCKMDSVTRERHLLAEDSYSDIVAGCLENDSGDSREVSVKLYRKTSTYWEDIFTEASLLKSLENTCYVPKLLGVTSMEMGSQFWLIVLVCDMSCCQSRENQIFTLEDTLTAEKEKWKTSKVQWIRLCIEICEMVHSFHENHVIPLNITTQNILLKKDRCQWRPFFNGLQHGVHDNGKTILQIDTAKLPPASLLMLHLRPEELNEKKIYRRKRGINTYSVGGIFKEISKFTGISFGSLIRHCCAPNQVSRPSLQFIIEKLGEIGEKYETMDSE